MPSVFQLKNCFSVFNCVGSIDVPLEDAFETVGVTTNVTKVHVSDGALR